MDAAILAQVEQMSVTADDVLGVASDGAFEDLVIFGIHK